MKPRFPTLSIASISQYTPIYPADSVTDPLWRREGLKVPRKQRKKRRLGTSANGIVRRRAEHINHVWCYDFVKDQPTDSRPLKFLLSGGAQMQPLGGA